MQILGQSNPVLRYHKLYYTAVWFTLQVCTCTVLSATLASCRLQPSIDIRQIDHTRLLVHVHVLQYNMNTIALTYALCFNG